MHSSEVVASLAGSVDHLLDGDAVIPLRLHADLRRYADPSLILMAEFASGVRLRLRTDADRVVLEVELTRLAMRHLGRPEAPARAVLVDGGDDVVAETDDTGVVRESADRRLVRGASVLTRLIFPLARRGERDVVLWLPHDAGVRISSVRATRGGRPTGIRPSPVTPSARWVHHGSSISHGGSATLPTGTWPARVADTLGLDLVNLGFGGNAMLDPATARTIARTPADAITLELGVNIVGGDAMRARTFVPAVHGFLDLVREGHPETPIVLLSAFGCAALEGEPGPLRAGADGRVAASPRERTPGDGTLTLQVTRALLAEVVRSREPHDPRIGMVDGLRLLGAHEGRFLPDGLHPEDEGYALIARRFVDLVRTPGEALGRAFSHITRASGAD